MPETEDTMHPLTARQEEILAVSARLFAMHGYAAVSMRELANAVKMTPAALYHHYADKEALYFAVLRYVFAEKAQAASKLAKAPGSVEARFGELINWLTGIFSGDVIFTRLLSRELLDENRDRIRLLTREIVEPTLGEIEGLIEKLAPRRNARSLTVSAFAMVLGYFQLMPVLQSMSGESSSEDGNERAVAALVDNVRRLVLGVCPEPMPANNAS